MTEITQDDFEDLIINSNDFKKLENQLNRFNIFEAVGSVRAELRHSNFLSFLFDPLKPHGLDTKFLEQFLFCISKETDFSLQEIDNQQKTFKNMIFDISLNGIKNIIVDREKANIDILIEFETQADRNNKLGEKYLIVIENKIDSTEGNNQLERYKNFSDENYPEHIKTLIYLTREGDVTLNSKKFGYIPVSYSLVLKALNSIIEEFENILSSSILLTLNHYKTVLKEHIVEESELVELSQQIYRKHKASFDFVYNNMPDYRNDIGLNIQKNFVEKKGYIIARKTKSRVNFVPKTWVNNSSLTEVFDGNWIEGFPYIQYEFVIARENLSFAIYLGPVLDEEVRKKAYDLLSQQAFLKGPTNYKSGGKFSKFKFAALGRNISKISQLDADGEKIKNYLEKVFELIAENQEIIDVNVIEQLTDL